MQNALCTMYCVSVPIYCMRVQFVSHAYMDYMDVCVVFFFLHSPVRKLMCNYSAERCTQFMRTRAQERGSGKGCELLPLSVSASTQTAGSLIEPLRICILYLHELVRIKQREYGGVQQQYPRKREKKTN